MLLELSIIGQRGETLVLLCHGKLILMKDVESGRYSHMPLPRVCGAVSRFLADLAEFAERFKDMWFCNVIDVRYGLFQ